MDVMDRLDAAHRSVLRAIPEDFLDLDDIPGTRRRFEEMSRQRSSPERPADLRIDDHDVAAEDGHPVLVRLYRPAGLPAPAPVLYWVHGGGMVMGSVAQDDDYCISHATKLNIAVASVEYRLAPEHPFPTPVEDCYAGLRWLAARADELGIDRQRVAIGGASAGGGIAAGLALLARDRGEVPVCFQFLVYPMLDDRNATPSAQTTTDPRMWNRRANDLGWRAYLGERAGTEDVSPYAAPARAGDLSGLPPAYINVGDLDLFLDEDLAYAQKLLQAGVPTELHVYPGAFHGSDNLVSRSALSRRWKVDERAALDRALNRSEGDGKLPKGVSA
jgi:acetyl esterase/lipase